MSPEAHTVLRFVHIVCGSGSFVLGGIVALLPKFGGAARWHRLLGRFYAASMLVMAGLAVPLAWRNADGLLFVIGLLTLVAVVAGWGAIRAVGRVRSATTAGRRQSLIVTHLNMMGASYISAWTAFFVANHPFGHHGPLLQFAYWFGPGLVGGPLIARASRRYLESIAPPSASTPAASGGIGAVVR